MADLLVVLSITIQVLAVIMILYTFISISEKRFKFPKIDALEKYHIMRNRYERLRWSLLFVVALIIVQMVGLYLLPGTITMAQILLSDVIIVALILFLTTIYREKDNIQDLGRKGSQK